MFTIQFFNGLAQKPTRSEPQVSAGKAKSKASAVPSLKAESDKSYFLL